ncbi:hypothetical protein NPIL_360641 [Nephila pilipes]|uniref:Uncharacterized protein n=1 Tax=Nephila pilipes TaxID=299642 RepID=A0A8X6U0X8_NEPPI|nr:hypothetical protein NPIL_360641 [Nephila pilipes]
MRASICIGSPVERNGSVDRVIAEHVLDVSWSERLTDSLLHEVNAINLVFKTGGGIQNLSHWHHIYAAWIAEHSQRYRAFPKALVESANALVLEQGFRYIGI